MFLGYSVEDNLLEQTDLRNQLSQAGLSLWDNDYNYYGLTGADGQSSGYNDWIADDNTDPAGLARLFSRRVYSLPPNGISGLMQHEAIVFKSCVTGNVLLSDADVTAVKGYYEIIHRFIVSHPEKLFVLLTTPPLNAAEADAAMAMRARQVAEWLLSENFQRGQANLYVFDLYGQLAGNDPASADFGRLRAAYRDGSDNHPNRAANQAVAPLLAYFVVQSVEAFRTAQD